MCFPPFKPDNRIDFIAPIGNIDHVSAGEVVLWFDEIRLYTGDGPSRVRTAEKDGRYQLIIKNYNTMLQASPALLHKKYEFVIIALTSDDARTIKITTGFATMDGPRTAVIFSDGGVKLTGGLEPGGEHMIAVGREDAECHKIMEHAHKLGLNKTPTNEFCKTYIK